MFENQATKPIQKKEMLQVLNRYFNSYPAVTFDEFVEDAKKVFESRQEEKIKEYKPIDISELKRDFSGDFNNEFSVEERGNINDADLTRF